MTKESESKQLSWSAPEFVYYPKGITWTVAVLVVGGIFTAFFAFRKDFLTATLFLLLTILTLYFSRQKPGTIEVVVDSRGVKMNDVKLSFDNIKSFWIVYDPPEIKALNFETTAYLNRYVTIQLADQDPVEVRQFLLEHLPEDLEKEEHITDKISRKIGF